MKVRKLSAAQAYVEDPSKCPFCGSTNLDGEGVDIVSDGQEATQCVTCTECGAALETTFTISSARTLVKPVKKKPTFSAWVFPESGDFMVCTDGVNGGAVIEPELYAAFDLRDDAGMTNWCVRQKLKGGDSVPIAEVYNGAAQDILTGVNVNGHKLSEGEADGLQFELANYLAVLFAKAPKMQQLIRQIQTEENVPQNIRDKCGDLMMDIFRNCNNDA